MRRAAARRAASARASGPAAAAAGSKVMRRLRTLAALIDEALSELGAQPAFSDSARGAAPGGPRTKTLDARSGPRDGSPSGGTSSNGRGDHSASHGPEDNADSSRHNGHAAASAANGAMAEDHVETWRLVERVQRGDGEAFGQLFDRYNTMVYRFVYYRINDQALAEDFTQETFLRALRRIGTISYQGRDIGAWFVTIARNIVLDHVKSARSRLESTTGDPIESKEYAPSTENAVLTALQNEQLMAAVAQLGPEQRECVTLRFVHGMSVNETASIMNKNDGAIKALQHRAVRKLADLVDRP